MNLIPKYDQCQSGAIFLYAYLEWHDHEVLACFAMKILQWLHIFLNISRTLAYFLKFFVVVGQEKANIFIFFKVEKYLKFDFWREFSKNAKVVISENLFLECRQTFLDNIFTDSRGLGRVYAHKFSALVRA